MQSPLKTNSKKILQILAEKTAKLINLDKQLVFNVILQCEKLVTSVRNGIAISHRKFSNIEHIIGVVLTLKILLILKLLMTNLLILCFFF
ncbi:MAG: hypothetical protein PG977_001070 [Bartonella clarridgeiae]|nr:MAG: hypothetical protein PG977_001070 [Bartonella clarridgeiae]